MKLSIVFFILMGISFIFLSCSIFEISYSPERYPDEIVDCFDKYGNEIIGEKCIEKGGTVIPDLLLISFGVFIVFFMIACILKGFEK